MEAFVGTILPFAFNFAPSGWLPCNGQTLAISQYNALFALIGVTYGGNGTTTFMLPNLQGRNVISQGTGAGSTYVMGEVAGSTSATILLNNMPIHNHLINVSSAAGVQTTPVNGMPAMINTGSVKTPVTSAFGYAPAPPNGQMAPTTVATSGGSVPMNVQNPYLILNYCICINGLFPSRN